MSSTKTKKSNNPKNDESSNANNKKVITENSTLKKEEGKSDNATQSKNGNVLESKKDTINIKANNGTSGKNYTTKSLKEEKPQQKALALHKDTLEEEHHNHRNIEGTKSKNVPAEEDSEDEDSDDDEEDIEEEFKEWEERLSSDIKLNKVHKQLLVLVEEAIIEELALPDGDQEYAIMEIPDVPASEIAYYQEDMASVQWQDLPEVIAYIEQVLPKIDTDNSKEEFDYNPIKRMIFQHAKSKAEKGDIEARKKNIATYLIRQMDDKDIDNVILLYGEKYQIFVPPEMSDEDDDEEDEEEQIEA